MLPLRNIPAQFQFPQAQSLRQCRILSAFIAIGLKELTFKVTRAFTDFISSPVYRKPAWPSDVAQNSLRWPQTEMKDSSFAPPQRPSSRVRHPIEPAHSPRSPGV